MPFCDHRLAEFVFGLPASYLMGASQTKRLLREAVRGVLPEAILTRWGKQGFVPPQDVWMTEGLLDAVETIIEDGSFARRGWWNVRWCRNAVARFRAGERNLAATLWKLLIAETWQRYFVDRVRSDVRVTIFDGGAADARSLRQSLSS